MYKRDLITAEIEKLAQVLARIMGLKVELKLDEAQKLFEETLLNHFGLDLNLLVEPNTIAFIEWLKISNHNAEKLNSLGDFLFSELDFEREPLMSQLYAQKLNLVYQYLADELHTVHLINLGRQKYIQQYI